MNHKHKNQCVSACTLALLLLLPAGCTTVVRENIISSVDTGIGIQVAENPKTELYEVKAGFIRSQFYSVPTGKTVKGATNNAANLTPELVSGIKMHSGVEHLLVGMDVAENFAVGSIAVMSPAATAMYVADAKKGNSGAASDAASAVSEGPEFKKMRENKKSERGTLAELRLIYNSGDQNKQKSMRDEAVKMDIVPPDTDPKNLMKALNFFAEGTDETTAKLNKLLETIK